VRMTTKLGGDWGMTARIAKCGRRIRATGIAGWQAVSEDIRRVGRG
jgi:hypothetical protein